MKKKLIVGIILTVMVLPMFLNLYKVEAFSGELDPENYINLPLSIMIEGESATETMSLSSSASGYSLAYQKVDLTDTQFNSIKNKMNELNNYIDECNNALKTKESEINTLESNLEGLKNSETATEEQVQEALNIYNDAVEEYNELSESYKTSIDNKRKEYYALIPSYTGSWTETTNTENNVKLDFKNYSGTVHFILWGRATNGTNTYYDMSIYTSNIERSESITIDKTSANIKVDETLQLTATSSANSKITWSSSDNTIATVSSNGLVQGVKQGTVVITAKGSEKTATCTVTVGQQETTDGEWTDFSKAKFELEKYGRGDVYLQITGVTPKDEKRKYYIFITNNANKPDMPTIASDTEGLFGLQYDSEKKMFKTSKSISKYLELNRDVYITIIEYIDNKTQKIILFGEKIGLVEPQFSDAFSDTTMVTYSSTQIITQFAHDESNDRKMQIKIGKITDKSILQKIKNEDVSGFASLLSYAKSNDGIYDKLVDARKNSYYIGYIADSNDYLINLNGLQDEAYYFLYVKTYDENGKYVSNEAVTLAQASVYNKEGSWFLFFYGEDDFKWADFGDVKEDNTKAPEVLPNTGIGKYIAIISVLSIVVIASYIQVKKLKEIK